MTDTFFMILLKFLVYQTICIYKEDLSLPDNMHCSITNQNYFFCYTRDNFYENHQSLSDVMTDTF